MNIHHFFDNATYTLTYVVYDASTRDAVIIDSVLDYDPLTSEYRLDSVNKVLDFVRSENLTVHYCLETHAHADHLTGSQFLKKALPQLKVGIGAEIKHVQKTFKHVFNFKEFNESGVQFDELFADEATITAGSLSFKVLYTPGHTQACVSYLFQDRAVFTGDALFMPDFGTGRCDFPGGSAEDLYRSITTRLFTLPDTVEVYTGHDYQPKGRELRFKSTIGEEKAQNIQLDGQTSQETFIDFRTTRDAQLKSPRLLLQSLQVNIDAGHLPEPEDDGISYLKLPIKVTA